MTHEEYQKQKPIHDEQMHDHIRELAKKEADYATRRYNLYHSPHEGFAIIAEEVDELNIETHLLIKDCDTLSDAVRKKAMTREYHIECAGQVYSTALKAAHEAIHVAATAKRYLESLRAENGEFEYLPKNRRGDA